jgi:hypothetical protein
VTAASARRSARLLGSGPSGSCERFRLLFIKTRELPFIPTLIFTFVICYTEKLHGGASACFLAPKPPEDVGKCMHAMQSAHASTVNCHMLIPRWAAAKAVTRAAALTVPVHRAPKREAPARIVAELRPGGPQS